jgi:hypothetical protein
MHDLLITELRATHAPRLGRLADALSARREHLGEVKAGMVRNALGFTEARILDAMAYARLVRVEGEAARPPGADPDLLVLEVEESLQHAAYCVLVMRERAAKR